MKKITVVLLAALLTTIPAGGCATIKRILAPAALWGAADFTTYVAMGTSISAGKQSNALVVQHQRQAFPFLFAAQAGVPSFTIPGISPDGLPAILKLLSLSPLVISNATSTPGSNTNASQPTAYHNMAIPGALLADVADSSLYDAGRDTTLRIIQRFRGTILQQVASLAPTFITFEYGVNEILGPATAGSGTPLLSTAQFAGLLAQVLNALDAVTNAGVAIVNVADPADAPFFTTFPPFALDAQGNPLTSGGQFVTLIGPGGMPLLPNEVVTLTAGDSLAIGTGFPVGTFSYVTGAPGNGRPLLDSQTLTTSELSQLQATVDGYNVAIATEALARGYLLVNANAFFSDLASNGVEFQGTRYSTDFVTGGLFSLDGVHPNDLAHGVACNALIDAVNTFYGASIPPVNLALSATPGSSRARPARGERRLIPWVRNAQQIADGFTPRMMQPLP